MNRICNFSFPLLPPVLNSATSRPVPLLPRPNPSQIRQLLTKSFRQLSSEDAIQLSHQYLSPNYADIIPVTVHKTCGPYVITPEGKKWFCLNGAYGAANFGHNRKEIIAIEHQQALKASLPSRAYYNDILPLVAEKLHQWYDPVLQPAGTDQTVKFMPKNTGGEVCDAAIKLMRKAGADLKGIKDGDQLILVFHRNFHGRPISVISASNEAVMHKGFGPLLPGFLFCDLNDSTLLKQLFQKYGSRICGAMIEYVQGEGGVHVAHPDFLSQLRNDLTLHRAMLIADDVQTGWGRTGKLSPSQHFENGKPDGIVFAKSCTGGISPAAGLVARGDWMQVMTPGTEGSTYGGNPKSMAAMLAAMDLYEELDLGNRLAELGVTLRIALEKWKDKNPGIKEIRGLGAMLAVEWHTPELGTHYKLALRSIGAQLGKDVEGITLKMTEGGKTMRINPTLMTPDELDTLIEMIAAV